MVCCTGYTFPYLYDSTQDTAKAYKASCTPEFYVFDKSLKLQYHGQFDDARPNNGKQVTGASLPCLLPKNWTPPQKLDSSPKIGLLPKNGTPPSVGPYHSSFGFRVWHLSLMGFPGLLWWI